jgi:hypothetical protein
VRLSRVIDKDALLERVMEALAEMVDPDLYNVDKLGELVTDEVFQYLSELDSEDHDEPYVGEKADDGY